MLLRLGFSIWCLTATVHASPHRKIREVGPYPPSDIMLDAGRNTAFDSLQGRFSKAFRWPRFIDRSPKATQPEVVPELNGLTEDSIEGYAGACSEACEKTDCFGFAIAYYEDPTSNECALFKMDKNYDLAEHHYETMGDYYLTEKYMLIFVRDGVDCGDDSFFGYGADGLEQTMIQQMGCNKKLADGVTCELNSAWEIYYAHIFNNGCEGPCTHDAACKSGRCIDVEHQNFDTATICGADETATEAVFDDYVTQFYPEYPERFEELIRGEYSVEGYKTLRSKPEVGYVTLYYIRYLDSLYPKNDGMEAVSSLAAATDFSSADEYSKACANECTEKLGCMAYTIVWRAETSEENACWLITDDTSLTPSVYQWIYMREVEIRHVGLLFIPKVDGTEPSYSSRTRHDFEGNHKFNDIYFEKRRYNALHT